jgi:hypothetical protein
MWYFLGGKNYYNNILMRVKKPEICVHALRYIKATLEDSGRAHRLFALLLERDGDKSSN